MKYHKKNFLLWHTHTLPSRRVFSHSKLARAAVVCETPTSDNLVFCEAVIKWFYDHVSIDGYTESGSGLRPHVFSLSDGETIDPDYTKMILWIVWMTSSLLPSQHCWSPRWLSESYRSLGWVFSGRKTKVRPYQSYWPFFLDIRLWRRHCDDSVKVTTARSNLPVNMENLKVPVFYYRYYPD